MRGEWDRGLRDLETTIYAGGLTEEPDKGCCSPRPRTPDDDRPLLVSSNNADLHDEVTAMVGDGRLDDIFRLGEQF